MPNSLQHETSPYLLQHAHNPVDWLPWGPEALDRAKESDKPILLSIGYSACHWCHVMAHESFEDDATAAVMNELFVNIKVDREERPDLDRIYQLSQQLMTGRPGGWPLTVFLTPAEQWPIFAGTYFPKRPSFGMPSFVDVLRRVADYYRVHRDDVEDTAGRLLDALGRTQVTGTGGEFDARYADTARRRLGETFDAANGGFGDAPKFPHTPELRLLLAMTGDDGARRIARKTLEAMAGGGLFDHLGGGFFRYSVDAGWRIPHFEKMLYDNAALLGLYSEAAAGTGDEICAGAANATADWLLAGMRDGAGGFYATLDADSEGEEGRYYVFDRDEFVTALGDIDPDDPAAYFGLDRPPNFEDRAWHLQPRSRVSAFGSAGEKIETARQALLRYRDRRVPPARDEKILTGWNGLAIGGLAKAARYLGRPALGEAAAQCADFVREALTSDGRLDACFKDGRSRFPAYLDDYAFMAHGLVELMQWRFRARDLQFATGLADALIAHFADDRGGFFFTSDDHEQLIHRPKPLADEATPSGNGMAALALDTLGHLLGESRYTEAAAATVRSALPAIERHPEAHATLLDAMGRQIEPPEIVIVRADSRSIPDLGAELCGEFHPARLVFLIDSALDDLPGLLGAREARATPLTAYVCRGTECLAPVTDIDSLKEQLRSRSPVDP